MKSSSPGNREVIVDETLRDLYDSNPEYIARRDDSSHNARQIKLEVERFKVPGLVSVIPPDHRYSSVMEIGCATGDLLAAFPSAVSAGGVRTRKVGFDISPLNVAAARARYPDIEFVAGSFTDSDLRSDVVILSDILEHVPDDVGFLRQAAAHGGLVLINLPLEKSWSNAFRDYGIEDASGHLRAYSLEDGLRLIDDAGLMLLRSARIWSHETAFDVERRRLRRQELGQEYSGATLVRTCKRMLHLTARAVALFGRRFYPSNLFVSAVPRH
ncbi:SAM-dependent methyltransferase [Povalibacter uvarum]|uniref:SAM-dependent methyltransferase n=1 Tax=Povalibacter uvarum TaxID=732238 RepID=A0A841HEQ4_9GAMM|nr:class I SAM-dependent methyltransferase [Povalibacter uvarum]MBB6091601.1 SAM-dependent methyltransferase [Povalibacter uvarum]